MFDILVSGISGGEKLVIGGSVEEEKGGWDIHENSEICMRE